MCMALEVAEVERALLALPPQERAAVIHQGLLSLDGAGQDDTADADQAEVDAAWRAEFRRRIDEVESGAVTLVSGDESEARVRALLAELHQ